ncbi:MAG: succinate dehydrogenase, cytochrome b556 subunit [Gammaproteobacteria bacterium]
MADSEITGERRGATLSTARRPVFFDLFRLQFPVGSIASFLHRVSGVLLILSLPFLVSAFERSLSGPEQFSVLAGALGSPLAKLLLIVLAWALGHHIFAGIRHLLMDGGVGWQLRRARRSASIVIVAGIVVAVIFAALIV